MEYLGTLINEDGRVDEEINNMRIIQKANQILYQINNTLVRKKELTSKNNADIHSSVICHTTGPQPLPKRFLHLMRSRASSFK
jgi:hypothetical protein